MNRAFRIRTVLFLLLAFVVVLPAARAQFVKPHPDLLSAVARTDHSAVKPGESFTLQIRFRVGSGAWYYGPVPGGKIIPAQPARLKPPDNAPLLFGKPKWPKTETHVTDLGGQTDRHQVYTGVQTLEVPVKVKPGASKKSYSLAVSLGGQVCTPTTCIPLVAPARFRISVGGASVANKSPFPPFPSAEAKPGKKKTGGIFDRSALAPPSGSASGSPPGDFDLSKLKVETPKSSWLAMLLAAFLGGLILNFMPCVLPVVPIKVYAFLEHARQDPKKAFRLALAFAAGMLTVFLILGGIMASARGLWGAQFQHPAFVVTLGALMFVMALWLFGALNVSLPQSVAGARFSGEDYAGSFGMGALATVLATPCSGPFLGLALAWAAAQPAALVLLTFAAIGAGMASPYVALVAQPGLLKRLPKPGPWMETWKQSMGLVMFAVTLYFFNLLPAELHTPFLCFCLALGAAVWATNRWGGLTASSAKRASAAALGLALALIGGWNVYSRTRSLYAQPPAAGTVVTAEGLEWVPFNASTLNDWLRSGQTVVVEWTADWCPNCKFIENTVYRKAKVTNRLKRGVRLMRADMTREFPEAAKVMQQLGSQSIPFSVVFRGDDPAHPILLRDVYASDALLNALDGKTAVAKRS
jgi:thiol:disulfide interchange protein DsbD